MRIDVITYVPTLANDPPSAAAAVCLSTTAIIVAVPVPGIATSGQDVLLLHRYSLLRFSGGSQGSPVEFVGWDPSCWDQRS